MDPKPFKNRNGSICKKEKIGFIWARIKSLICNEMKHVGALAQITIYANFKWAVLNAKDTVRNHNPSSKKLRDYQKHRHSNSNAGQAQPLKKTFLKEKFRKIKARNPKQQKKALGPIQYPSNTLTGVLWKSKKELQRQSSLEEQTGQQSH